MDNFVKGLTAFAVAGAIACAIDNYVRRDENPPLTKDEQEYTINATEAEETNEELFCYGGIFNHLEKEKSFLAWSDKNGDYIADVYYTGDHYEDPRLMVVHDENTGETVQVVLTASYKTRSESYYKEVPE